MTIFFNPMNVFHTYISSFSQWHYHFSSSERIHMLCSLFWENDTLIYTYIYTHQSVFFKFLTYNFIFGCTGSSLRQHALSLFAASRKVLLQASHWVGFSLQCLLLWQSTGSSGHAQSLWHRGLIAPGHVESSQIRDRTCVPCIGRWMLNHWTTREVPYIFKFQLISFLKVKVTAFIAV